VAPDSQSVLFRLAALRQRQAVSVATVWLCWPLDLKD